MIAPKSIPPPNASSSGHVSGDVDVGTSEMTSIEQVHLISVLEQLSNRLSALEHKLVLDSPGTYRPGRVLIEMTKVLFAGWPALGLVFLILFYGPLRMAINAIPEKVKGAEEIGGLGFSLKTTFRHEAEKIGSPQLSDTLPALSPAAVELLLRSDQEANPLVTYSQESTGLTTVWFPTEQTLSTLDELQRKNLIEFSTFSNDDHRSMSLDNVRQEIAAFRKAHPGTETRSSLQNQVEWSLSKPAKVSPPNLQWAPTELGIKAVDVILKAVTTQLVRQDPLRPASTN